jgi:long-chain acyl-CoA synthetase
MYKIALGIARRHARLRWDNKATIIDRAIYALFHRLMFRPVLNKLGFDHLEIVISGGAPLPEDTMALWHMYGVNVVEMSGQTETAGGIISGQRGPFPRPGDVGAVPSGWQVRLGDDGEVLVRSDCLFEGYWNNEDATRSVFGADGFMRTGDVGEWRNGALKLIDRARDFIVTLGGKTLSPSFIENLLRASPYVAEAVVFGHGRKYLTAIVEIDYDTVADWARGRDIAYTGFTNLAENAQVEGLIKDAIDKANAELSRVEQI